MKNGKKFTGAYGGKPEKKEKSTIEKMNDILKNRPKAKRRAKRSESMKKVASQVKKWWNS